MTGQISSNLFSFNAYLSPFLTKSSEVNPLKGFPQLASHKLASATYLYSTTLSLFTLSK